MKVAISLTDWKKSKSVGQIMELVSSVGYVHLDHAPRYPISGRTVDLLELAVNLRAIPNVKYELHGFDSIKVNIKARDRFLREGIEPSHLYHQIPSHGTAANEWRLLGAVTPGATKSYGLGLSARSLTASGISDDLRHVCEQGVSKFVLTAPSHSVGFREFSRILSRAVYLLRLLERTCDQMFEIAVDRDLTLERTRILADMPVNHVVVGKEILLSTRPEVMIEALRRT